MIALPEAARRALMAMDPAKYEYQSEFARHYIGLGRAEGRTEGRAEGETQGRAQILLRQLGLRFGPVPEVLVERLRAASAERLDQIAERVLSAATLEEALKPLA